MKRPSPEQEQAGHAEVDRRYRRSWANMPPKERVTSLRRAEVKRVLKLRYGSILPEGQASERALQLLFELDLDGIAGVRLAPWADHEKIERLSKAADDNGAAWSTANTTKSIAEIIGERLDLDFDEYKQLGLRQIRPCDVQPHEVDKFLEDRRRDRDRAYRQRKRAADRAKANGHDPWDLDDPRAKAMVCGPLSNRQWWTIRSLAEFAHDRLGAFSGLDRRACERAILRIVGKLRALGIVQAKTEPGFRSLPVMSVQRMMTAAEIEDERQELMDEVAAEQLLLDEDSA